MKRTATHLHFNHALHTLTTKKNNMKEITPEIRQRIFALYWGQTLINPNYKTIPNDLRDVSSDTRWHHVSEMFLELTPLSKITDEDAEYIAYHFEQTAFNIQKNNDGLTFDFYYGDIIQSTQIYYCYEFSIDYLRSRGYALPYLHWSVDELIQAGVFKLNLTV